MARVSRSTTRNEIIQVACEYFFEKGYSATSPKLIASALGISPGNLTYHFPTKEHLLLVVVHMLCQFQWELLGIEEEQGIDSVGSVCLEMMTVAAACQEDEIARDFFTSAFQSEMCRDYLRNDHINRAKRIFVDHCSDWTDEDFVQAELLIMGIQYTTITADDSILPLKTRIGGALEYILKIYGIDSKIRQQEIDRVLQMDCRTLGRKVLAEFVKYVKETNEQAFSEMLAGNRRNILKYRERAQI